MPLKVLLVYTRLWINNLRWSNYWSEMILSSLLLMDKQHDQTNVYRRNQEIWHSIHGQEQVNIMPKKMNVPILSCMSWSHTQQRQGGGYRYSWYGGWNHLDWNSFQWCHLICLSFLWCFMWAWYVWSLHWMFIMFVLSSLAFWIIPISKKWLLARVWVEQNCSERDYITRSDSIEYMHTHT